MNDTINVTPARSNSTTTLASPKLGKQRPNPTPGAIANVAFGCEHTQSFYRAGEKSWKTLVQQYTQILKSLRDEPRAKIQTVKLGKDRTEISLRPTYLCLQCPSIFPQEGMKPHFENPKAHSFFVESRSGHIFCHNCEDFVYDPQLEVVRLRHSTTTPPRKRKFDDFASEPGGMISANSAFVPCRAIGLRGLYNMGNTCFMSVVIQSLLHNPFIKTWYLSEGHKSSECERDACTSCALDEIFCEFWSAEKTEGYGAVPMLLSSWKNSESLAGYQQQDAHEYMQFILNALHSTNNGNTIASEDRNCDCIIHKTFYGKLQSTVTCDECKNKTNAVDPFMDLSLDLRTVVLAKKRKLNGVTNGAIVDEAGMKLEECLRRFTNEEKLAKDEYTCHKCEKQRDATKQLSVKRLPPVLSIHLKRFSHTKDKSSKLETPVAFPIALDMAPYTTKYQSSNPSKPSKSKSEANGTSDTTDPPPISAKYTLSAVIVHKGEISSGHYVSYAREGRDWFSFDDSKVVLVGEGEVLSAQAYLLLYVAETF